MAERRPMSRGLRIGFSAILVLFLATAWGSGFDRLSARAPALERLVPWPLRAQAERSAAAIALARGDEPTALAAASRAVRADPLDPASSALLGSARQLAGDPRGAESAFRVAARRGWREPVTQLYWFDNAIGSGETDLAALRADAILRADPHFPRADDLLLAPLEASPEGQAALVRRLAERPNWVEHYLTPGRDPEPQVLRTRARVALATAAAGAMLGCEAPRRLTVALLEAGLRADAEALWQAHCADGVLAGGLADGGFEELAAESDSSPFGWRRNNRGDLQLGFAGAPDGGKLMTARNSATVSRLLVAQALALAPGRYRFAAEIRDASGNIASGRVVASLDCGGGAHRPERIEGDLAASGQDLVIGSCAGQTLGLWLRPGADEVTIDNLRIERLD